MIGGSQNLRSTRTYPTPTLRDYLFVEDIKADHISSGLNETNYGDAHPDTKDYPDHVLVFVSPDEINPRTKEKYRRHYYAANRLNQEDYNLTYQGHTQGKYEQYSRSYLVRRDDWDPNAAGGATNVPQTNLGDPDPHPSTKLTGFVLIDSLMDSTGSNELDSIYVLVKRIFRKHIELIDEVIDPQTNEAHDRKTRIVKSSEAAVEAINPSTGYKVEVTQMNDGLSMEVETRAYDPNHIERLLIYPTPNLADFIISEQVNALTFDTSLNPIGTAHPDVAYPDFVLSHISPERKLGTGKKEITLYYSKDRTNQHLHNYTHQGFTPGGKYKQYTRTYIVKRSDWEGDGGASTIPSLAPGATDTNIPTGCGAYVYWGDSHSPTGVKELDGIFVAITHVFRELLVLSGARYDMDSSSMFDYTETIVLAGNANSSPPDGNGVYKEVIPINTDWSLVRENKAFDPSKTRIYNDYITFYWPPVLGSIDIHPWNSGFSTSVNFYKYAFNGLCRATISEYFSTSAPTLPAIDPPMIPMPIVHNGPKLNVSVPACLRDTITIYEIYPGETSYVAPYLRSNYLQWPDSLVAFAKVTPYRGGYKTKIVTVYPPS